MVKKIKLPFTPRIEVEFTDRDRGIKQIYEIGERGTRFPIVVFGPEGCGKTSWLKQATVILGEMGFEVFYVNPLYRDFIAKTDIREVVNKFIEAVSEAIGVQFKLATLVTLIVRELLTRWGRKKIAVLVDDVFQAIGLDKAEFYVKELLGLIEHPPASYDNIVAIVATSEGVTRQRIGRHLWATIMPMWNMSREGFEELYSVVPSSKLSFNDIWRLTGGNPRIYSLLYQVDWDVDKVIVDLVKEKELTPSFISKWRSWLEKAVEDPDILWDPSTPRELVS
ncbi:MAG: ATP-binding protein, partial [Desulfurococcaceae archaeon]|nr:ATP-binding protein [Desulfurococcaceae archaeon]